MTDYSKLSDFEINKLVAIKDGYKIINNNPTPNKGILVVSNGVTTGSYDPCNNPSDAWPIIAENKIAIKPKLITKKEYATPSDYIDGWEAKVHSTWFEDKNPLRAAMIVYLMMKEQNND